MRDVKIFIAMLSAAALIQMSFLLNPHRGHGLNNRLCGVGACRFSPAIGRRTVLDKQSGNTRFSVSEIRLQCSQAATRGGWAHSVKSLLAAVPNLSSWINWNELGVDLPQDFSHEMRVQHHIVSCLNHELISSPMTWTNLLAGSMGELKAVGELSNSLQADDIPLTVVTTATTDRLPQLYAQCMSWPGPLSAAVYVPLTQASNKLNTENKDKLVQVIVQVLSLLSSLSTAACKYKIVILYELFQNEVEATYMFPYNMLRNIARLQAQSELIGHMDVDLTISDALYKRMLNSTRTGHMIDLVQKGYVFIVPCFDVSGGRERAAWADALSTVPKDVFVFAYGRGVVYQSARQRYLPGHLLVNYTHWTSTSTHADYTVEYMHRAEPFIIGHRKTLPWHDPRYRGYGCDKVQFLTAVNASGARFRVLHDAFVIHRAHKIYPGRVAYLHSMNNKSVQPGPGLYQYNHGLYLKQRSDHQMGYGYNAPQQRGIQACLSELLWW